MDSDSTKPSVESIQDSSKCIDVSNQPNLTGTSGDSSVHEEGVNLSVEGIDAVAPELLSPIGEGESTVFNSVSEISDVVEERTSVDVVSPELSPAEVGGGEEENADFKVQEMNSMDLVASMVGEGGEEERAALIVKEGDFAAEGSDSTLNGGNIDSEQANLSLEENKEFSMEEETPSHHLSVSEVNGVDSLKAEEKREEGKQVVTGGMVDDESSQAIESELGQNTESGKEKVDVLEEQTTAQAASLVNEIEMPDEKEVASVAGFTEILTQDKGLDDSVLNSGSEFVEEKPLKELHIREGAKDVTDGDAKEGVDVTEVAMDIQVLKKSEEEQKVDAASVVEIETKPQEMNVTENAMEIQVLKKTEEEGKVDDVATEVSEKNEGTVDVSSAIVTEFSGETQNTKETVIDDVEKDPEAGKSVDIHIPEAAEIETYVKCGAGLEKEGDGMGGAGEAGQTVNLEETQELSEELAKVDETKISELSEETETMIGDENQEKDDDMTDVAEDVETHGDSSVAYIEEAREDHEDKGIETQEETVNCKVNRTNIAEVSEETETMIEGEDQEKDNEMTDVAEDVETHGDSPVADIEEGKENNEEMEMTELTEKQEESVMAEMEDEEPEEVEEEEKSAGGKRKRVRNTKTVKGTGKKKEEDVCFICFDGGDLVLCDRRGCPKAYHPSCVNRDEAFFQSKGKWNCGWHLCSKCEKTATYLCYTCTFSLCKGCAKDDVFSCIRGNKGLCETCLETVKLMERKEQAKEPVCLTFSDSEEMPINLDVPSLADELRAEFDAAQTHAEDPILDPTVRPTGMIKKKNVILLSSEQETDVARRKSVPKAPKSKESRDAIAAGKKVAGPNKDSEQREAVQETQPEIVADQPPESGQGKRKRSSKEVGSSAEEPGRRQRAKTSEGWEFAYSGDVPLGMDLQACANLCKIVGQSCEPLSTILKMKDMTLFQKFAQCSIQTMGSVTEMYGRMNRRVKAAEDEKVQLEGVIQQSRRCFEEERARGDRLDTELRDLKLKRDLEMDQHKAADSELAELRSANERLKANYAKLQDKYRREVRRLRDSRAYKVSTERKIQDCLRKSCEATFDKVKSYLRGRGEVERIRSLYGQAKGTREILEVLRTARIVDVSDQIISDFVAKEEKYAALAKEMPDVQLAESDLVVPTTFEEISLEEKAQVNAYNSNERVIGQEKTQILKEPEPAEQ